MSRIGKNPITIPSGVTTSVNGQNVEVKGPKGTLSFEVPSPITVAVEDNQIVVSRPDDNRQNRALHGLSRSLVNNLVVGVTEGYSKRLEIVGTGYRAVAKGKGIEFFLGYSHTITVNPPEGIEFELPNPNQVIVKGTDKQVVGQVAANIRKLRKPEPYKGKGIRYVDERVRRKVGKAGK